MGCTAADSLICHFSLTFSWENKTRLLCSTEQPSGAVFTCFGSSSILDVCIFSRANAAEMQPTPSQLYLWPIYTLRCVSYPHCFQLWLNMNTSTLGFNTCLQSTIWSDICLTICQNTSSTSKLFHAIGGSAGVRYWSDFYQPVLYHLACTQTKNL